MKRQFVTKEIDALLFFFENRCRCVIMQMEMHNDVFLIGKEICMVNEERLHCMIKMAIFDTNEGKECRPMMQYTRKDYISLRLLGSFVSGTAGFLLGVVVWALYSLDDLMKKINDMDKIQEMLTSVICGYILFLVVYLGITYIVYQRRYTKGRRKVKKYYNRLKKLNQAYEQDEKLKMSEKKEWE